jgi:hypothetical protein
LSVDDHSSIFGRALARWPRPERTPGTRFSKTLSTPGATAVSADRRQRKSADFRRFRQRKSADLRRFCRAL